MTLAIRHRIVITILFLSLAHTTISWAQGTVTVAKDGAVVAKTSSPESSELSRVNAGMVLTVLQVDDEWVKIMLQGKRAGWVSRSILTLPNPDVVTIGRSWPLFASRGNLYQSGDSSGVKVGRVSKGTTARQLLLHGGWYHIELPGGVRGWVPQHAVEPSLVEVTRATANWIAVADTNRKASSVGRNDVQLEGGQQLIQLARGIGWVKVRTADGKEGWVEASKIHVDGSLPVDATNEYAYRAFEWLDKLGDKGVLLAIVVFLIHWIVLPVIPAALVFFMYYFTIGKIRFLNNWIVKTGYGLLAFFVGAGYNFNFISSIPPFMGGFQGALMQFWSFAVLIGLILGFIRRISYNRCNNCRKIGAGVVQGIVGVGGGKSVETIKTTYQYANGATRTQTTENTTNTYTTDYKVKCRYCGYTWMEVETSSTRATKVK